MRVLVVSGLCFVWFLVTTALRPSETPHQTKEAREKQHDLWCHKCDSMFDGDKCLNLTRNLSSLHHKCSKEQKKCQVRRISMSTSTEEVTGKPKLWLLQRNCSETCESGCTVIGERTKLHSCITCCDEHNFCNAGSGTEQVTFFLYSLFKATLNALKTYLAFC